MEYRYETSAFPLSTLMVYWVRSFVPMEKKSASLASISEISDAAGVSIMQPTSSPLSKATPALSKSFLMSDTMSFTSRSSSMQVTRGTIIFIFPKALARRIARSWVS